MISCYCALLSFDQRASAKVSGTIDAALARPAARSEPLLKQAPREAVQAQVQRVLLGEQGGRRRLVASVLQTSFTFIARLCDQG